MQCDSNPRKVAFQTLKSPKIIGMFSLIGAVSKWQSMACAPSRNFCMTTEPYCNDKGTIPTAEHTEKRPPTQSQKPNTLLSSIPNAFVLSRAVETAIMCLLTESGPSFSTSQERTVRAFNIVSAVVNVFEMTMTWGVVSICLQTEPMLRSDSICRNKSTFVGSIHIVYLVLANFY